jgi:hypothetical protein
MAGDIQSQTGRVREVGPEPAILGVEWYHGLLILTARNAKRFTTENEPLRGHFEHLAV